MRHLSSLFLTITLACVASLMFSLSAVSADVKSAYQENAPVEISADTLEVLQKKQQAIFTGDVIAMQGELSIEADRMIVYYRDPGAAKSDQKTKPTTKSNDAANRVSKIETIGNVLLSTPNESAQGSEGVYDVDRAILTLTGTVILTQGKSIVKGTKLVYNLKTGESVISSASTSSSPSGKKERVRGVFSPGK